MARLRYPELAPEGHAALTGFGHYVNSATALSAVLLGMIYLRASVLNGCEFCTELHKAELRKHHEPESRIEAVVVGPASDAFTPREQAALRWTDVITELQGGAASDQDYEEISRFFKGKELVDLTFAIANINAWNRMGIAFRPRWRPRPAAAQAEPAPAAVAQEAAPVTPPKTTPGDEQIPTRDVVDDDGGKVATD